MNKRLITSIAISFLYLTWTGHVPAQERKDFVSDASYIVGTYKPKDSDHSSKSMADSAKAFLNSLSEAQKKKTVGPLRGEIRRQWTNLPARPDADGIRLGELKPEQVKAACDLMASLMSEHGYKKLTGIMLADDQLLRDGRPRPGFGTENFSVVIFGEPDEQKPWGFQLDGHHVGVNLAVEGKKICMSPSFIGTQPESFKIATNRWQPMGLETKLAYKLAGSLTFEQLKTGIISDERGPILLGPGQDGRIPRKTGVCCSTFSDNQKEILGLMIAQWVNVLPPDQAKARLVKITEEIDQTYFAWSGEKKPNSDVSFIIQGPSLIIEYACQDLGGNPLNHLHSVYRDPTNEYGGQLKKTK